MNSLISRPIIAGEKIKEKVSALRSSEAFSSQLLIENYANFKRSSSPERFMFYENGSWMDYPRQLTEAMKLGFTERKAMVEVRVLGFNCLIDFFRMLEIELDSGNYRSISWIDSDGKCLFPKSFFNSSEKSNELQQKIRVCVEIGQGSGSCEGSELNRGVNLRENEVNSNQKIDIDARIEQESESCDHRFVHLSKRKIEENEENSCLKIDIDARIEQESANCDHRFVHLSKRKIQDKEEKSHPKIRNDARVQQESASCDNRFVHLSKRKREESGENEILDRNVCSNGGRRQWMVVGSELESARWEKTRNFGPKERGYAVIMSLLKSGLQYVEPDISVSGVHQCVRVEPMDKARFEVFAKQVEFMRQARGKCNVVFAWYGTSAKGVESILMHGFGVPSDLSRPNCHGIGIHLSPVRMPQNSAMFSEIDDNGEKHLVLCRVILGKCEKVEAESQQSYPSSMEYDTGVDDLVNPTRYTVWPANVNTHILPEYVISYRPANTPVAQLLSKLTNELPPPRFKEMQTLWELCKEGKLGKDNFMMRLRSSVGETALRTAIQEIRGGK